MNVYDWVSSLYLEQSTEINTE